MSGGLERLRENAQEWAQTYATLVEALQSQGVEERTARAEANDAATFSVLMPEDPGPYCPVCGRGEQERSS